MCRRLRWNTEKRAVHNTTIFTPGGGPVVLALVCVLEDKCVAEVVSQT